MVRMLLVWVSCVAAVCGQGTRVLRFVHLEQPEALMEAATVIRSVGEIRDLRVDAPSREMTLSGAQWQMDLAGWLI